MQLPVGLHSCTLSTPRGLVSFTRPQTFEVRAGEELLAQFELQVVTAGMTAQVPTTIPRLRLVAQRFGWAAREIVVYAGAVGHGGGYHFEADAPDGLMITRARLVVRPTIVVAYAPSRGQPGQTPNAYVVHGRLQRAHLYLSEVPQGSSGLVKLWVRPRPTTIVRAAVVAAILTALLLCLVAWRASTVADNVGAVATLLVLAPGALAAYIARPREPEVTSAIIFYLRMLALLPALLSVCAAASLIFSRTWGVDASGHSTISHEWSGTQAVLIALAVGAVLVAVVQASVSVRVSRARP
jgi:hypothetical protein